VVGWLITWEWWNGHTKIALALRGRLSPKRVKEIVESLYAYSQYTPSEFVRYCVEKNGKDNPYPAKFADIKGVTWEGRIYCGDNPRLYARKVDNLDIYMREDGESDIRWEERPIPKYVKEAMKGDKRGI